MVHPGTRFRMGDNGAFLCIPMSERADRQRPRLRRPEEVPALAAWPRGGSALKGGFVPERAE
jgi:hypothetical protein